MNKILQKSSVIWIPIICYLAAIEVIVLFRKPELFLSKTLFLNRVILALIFFGSYFLYNKLKPKVWNFVTIVAVYASLTVLYKETAILNTLFYPVIDPILIRWDQAIFGFQPAIKFSEILSSAVISELLFFGYFSYYLMPLAVFALLWKFPIRKIQEFGFILICSFLVYYLFFIMIPAVGPQFYWDYPENHIDAQGIFGKIIKIIQKNGEVPTAAFPSSHVGIALIILIWLYQNLRKKLFYFVPFVFLLILATVYIKAHYVVDVIGGILSAPLVYFFSNRLFQKIPKSYADYH